MHHLTGNSKLICFTSVPNTRHLSRNEMHARANADPGHVTAAFSVRGALKPVLDTVMLTISVNVVADSS